MPKSIGNRKKRTEPEKSISGDTIQINTAKSNIHWKGTKMCEAGKHEVEIELKSGYFIINNDKLLNGNFIVDMSTIGVTDIPEHEPVPRKNLSNHLKSSYFFDVEKFPELQIIKVDQITSDSTMINVRFPDHT